MTFSSKPSKGDKIEAMKKTKTIALMLLFFLPVLLLGQVSGYLGKKVSLNYNFHFRPAILSLDDYYHSGAKGNIPFYWRHHLGLEFPLKHNQGLEIAINHGYFNTGRGKLNESFSSDVSGRGTFTALWVDYKISLNPDLPAPVGPYCGLLFNLGMVNASFHRISDGLLVSSVDDPAFGIGFELGSRVMLSNAFSLNYGCNLLWYIPWMNRIVRRVDGYQHGRLVESFVLANTGNITLGLGFHL